MHEGTGQQTDLVLVCEESHLPSDGTVITRSVSGKTVAIARRSPGEEEVVAFQSRCPHMQAPLKFGRVVDGEVVCPWHFFRFDTRTGAAVACAGSMMRLATYTVEQKEGKILLRIDELERQD